MRKILSFWVMMIWALPALAGTVVQDIQVKGLQRLEPPTVISYLPFKKGDTIDNADTNKALKELYKTGFFSDVQVQMQDQTVVVTVDERPIVSYITFEGNDKIDEEVLFGEVQLKVRDIYTPTKLKADVNRLENVYRRMGLNDIKIDPEVVNKTKNRVEITFKIDEGPKNYIEDIVFEGNKRYSSSDLREVLMSKEKRWYRFLTSTDTYDPDRLNYDKELLRRFYMQKGYVDFEITNMDAQLDKKSKNYIIKFVIHEGKRYKFGNSKVKVTLPEVNVKALEKQIVTKPGKTYNANLVEETVQHMTDELGRQGYAFVDINPQFEKEGDHIVHITYRVKEGARVFVNQINISGNSRTLDKVIRREFRLAEGDPFNTDRIRRSRQRIDNLGYFDKVDLKTVPVANAPDKTDIAVNVSEKSTGSFNVGVGWSTYDGLLFEVGVQERNLLGTGNIVGVTASTSTRETQVDLSYTNPYFLDMPASAGFDLFNITRDYTDDSSYKWKTIGGSLRSGWDYTERFRQTIKYTLQQDDVTDIESDASLYVQKQAGKNNVSMMGETMYYDTRDSVYNPTEGFYGSLGLDMAGLGGDTKFVRVNATAVQYYEIMDKWVFSLSAGAGYIHGLGGQDVRINNAYYLGGSNLRGFEVAGVGARDMASDDSLGGDWRVTASAQLMFPLGLPSEFGMRGKLFMDAGILGKPSGVDDWNDVYYDSAPRVSVGTGLLWQSPMGPINLDFGFPIVKESYDKREVFRLNFGVGI